MAPGLCPRDTIAVDFYALMPKRSSHLQTRLSLSNKVDHLQWHARQHTTSFGERVDFRTHAWRKGYSEMTRSDMQTARSWPHPGPLGLKSQT